jgi:hypothetical protein
VKWNILEDSGARGFGFGAGRLDCELEEGRKGAEGAEKTQLGEGSSVAAEDALQWL